jgi:tetratricopeptide (TPR) repeat protein
MHRNVATVLCALLLSGAPSLMAQSAPPVQAGGQSSMERAPRPKTSPEAKAALQRAKDLAGRVKGAAAADRSLGLETAAKAYEQVAADFAAEALVAAQARWEAGELWRRQGSLLLAEQCYLESARLDADRYGQRGTLAAADMQRRQKRTAEALETYARAETLEPGSTRAQEARLWRARLLQSSGRLDAAVIVFRAAVEAAHGPRQEIEAANWLAKALIAAGDLEGAAAAIGAADEAVAEAGEDDVVEQERLQKALESMSARKALQRARDKKHGAAKDAGMLEGSRTGGRS